MTSAPSFAQAFRSHLQRIALPLPSRRTATLRDAAREPGRASAELPFAHSRSFMDLERGLTPASRRAAAAAGARTPQTPAETPCPHVVLTIEATPGSTVSRHSSMDRRQPWDLFCMQAEPRLPSDASAAWPRVRSGGAASSGEDDEDLMARRASACTALEAEATMKPAPKPAPSFGAAGSCDPQAVAFAEALRQQVEASSCVGKRAADAPLQTTGSLPK